ncbi:hypothetical protein KU306_10470 [Haloferax larsenii]|uniref:DUF7308 domain-containing protein n=1 Tax=Haloferax larsenii TaxID=302484 RepID=A0ABY5RAI6_HALLR|nr:hypothetical protein [Haloferax larsenii]UVE49347.1 hypothetical protein KU306_10470 [Haloferax larsenii]
MSRPRVPWLYRVVRDRSGQTSPLAVVILLGITVLGTTAVVTLGATALDETKQASNTARAEHSMTLFDSKMAITALGDSRSQSVELGGSNDGQYVVRDDTTRLIVTHKDYDDFGSEQEIYNETLGSIEYREGDVTIAYEGGGVWRTEDNGTSMVSPPEFHYRGATLTFPLIQLTGSGGSGRNAVADITERKQADPVYPNSSVSYANTSGTYSNPVRNGTVEVTVVSPHYKGWAQFFDDRTEGNMSIDHTNESVSVELETLGLVGDFQMPNEGNSINVRGMAGDHNVSEYTLNLTAKPHFQNMHWSMYHDGPDEDIEFHIYSDGKCKNNGGFNGEIDISIYYSNQSGTYQGWQKSNIDPTTNPDVSVDCSTDPGTLNIDLTSPNIDLEYGDITMTGSDNKWYFGPEIKSSSTPSSVTFDQHPSDGPTTYTAGDKQTLNHLTNHYLSLISPRFELTVTDGPGGSERIDEGASSGSLVYDQAEGGRFITFLHVTENRVEVDVS